MRSLEGVRVLDLTRLLPGPFASLVLADLGATVDKVEDTGPGDYVRLTPPIAQDGTGVLFHTLNRGKRSLLLDLKKPEGVQAFRRLVSRYDVLFEQFRPGVLDRLGIGHASLLASNPRLVVCALTGYGQTGPLKDRAGHDLNYMARGGLLGFTGPGDGQPFPPGYQVADVGGGLWCVIGILAALRQRELTGKGSVVDISMTESVIPFGTSAYARLFGGELPARGGEHLTGGIAPYQTYRTADGEWMALGALEPKFLMAFLRAAELEADLSAVMPGPHQAALGRRFAEAFAKKTRAEWVKIAEEHDCMLEPVLRPEELLDDPHLRARGVFTSVNAGGTELHQYRTPVTPRDVDAALGPRAGEHTNEVLGEAGFSSDEIALLRSAGAVR